MVLFSMRGIKIAKQKCLTASKNSAKLRNYRKMNRDNYAQAERNWKQGVKQSHALFFFLFPYFALVCVVFSPAFQDQSSNFQAKG